MPQESAAPYPYIVEERAQAVYQEFRNRITPEIAPSWDDAPPYVRGLTCHVVERKMLL